MKKGLQGAFCDCEAPGFNALARRIGALYGDAEPLHYGSTDHVSTGGVDPIEAISAYAVDEPLPHWHLISFGMSELYDKVFNKPEVSGYGFELSMRVVREEGEDGAPAWAMNLMQTLAAYVHATGRAFDAGQSMDTKHPLSPDVETLLTAVCFAEDPTLGIVESPNGIMRFLQVVGITPDEVDAMMDWDGHGVLELIAARDPLLMTDLHRDSLFDDEATASQLRARMAAEGSSQSGAAAGRLDWEADEGDVALKLSAIHVAAMRRGLLRRVPFGDAFVLAGRDRRLMLEPASAVDVALSDDPPALRLSASAARALGETLRPERGVYQSAAVPGLTIIVEPTEIADGEGRVVSVIG